MNVIITGANGFVGSNIVSMLIKQGWFVYAVDLGFDNPAVKTWDSNQVELITSSCTDLPPLSVDALIHGAFITASPEARNESPEANLRANLDPMLAIMEYVEQNNIKRSIFLSSSGVYRTMPNMMIDETRPQEPLGVYAVAKTMMEHLVETMQTIYKRNMICVRLGNIYGQYEYQRASRPFLSVIGQMVYMAVHDRKIIVNHPAEAREWTYANDIGNAIHTLLTTETLNYSLYHVASGDRESNLEIAKRIQQVIQDVKIEIDEDPNPKTPRLTRLGILDNTRLTEDTGFENWTSIDEGIAQLGLNHELRSMIDA